MPRVILRREIRRDENWRSWAEEERVERRFLKVVRMCSFVTRTHISVKTRSLVGGRGLRIFKTLKFFDYLGRGSLICCRIIPRCLKLTPPWWVVLIMMLEIFSARVLCGSLKKLKLRSEIKK